MYLFYTFFSFDVHIVQVWIGLEWIISSFGDIFGSVHIESEMGKPVGYLLRVELVHCSRGPAWTKQGQIACPTLLLNGSYHPTFRVQELQFSSTTTKRRLQQSMTATMKWVCDVFLSCDLRLVDLILCVIWGWSWQPYYADHCALGESHARGSWSCLLPRATPLTVALSRL